MHVTTHQPKTIYLKDYRPADFSVEDVHLNFDLRENETIVKGILKLRRNPMADKNAPLVLDGEEMTLKQVSIDGKLLSAGQYHVDAHSLTIPQVPDQFLLETEVIIHPEKNTHLSGLYQSRGNYCTQCESHGFRYITYYLDRPDVLSKFTTTITADKKRYPVLLSNGNLIEDKTLENGRHWVRWEDPFKKPSYLFALVAGDFDLLEDTFTTMSGREIKLYLYLEKGFKDQGHHALEALKKAMRWDEETFGREYDLDIYMIFAVSDFNMGAMENKGLNIFNTKYILANEKTATDVDYFGIESVIGHEYFHNWSGNRVTCRDWFQITLKEGLTVFREQLFGESLLSPGVSRIQNVNFLRSMQFAEDAGPMAHPIRPRSYIEINNFYTTTVYRKGSEVIRMVQTLLGKTAFRKAMDLYFSRFDGQAVTTEDFIQAMQEGSGFDLTQFRRWYDQVGTPRLDVTGDYNEGKKTFTLTVKQTSASAEPLLMPLAMGLIGSKTHHEMMTQLATEKNALSGTRVLQIKKPVESFEFVNVTEKPIPSLLRHFSAPVVLHYPYTDDELLQLFQHDTDYFARWEAGQELMKRLIFKLVSAVQKHQPMQMDHRLIEAFQHILSHAKGEWDYVAMLLTLPNISYLMLSMDVIDVDALHQAHEFVKKSLAKALVGEFAKGYTQHPASQYQYSREEAAKRTFKNRCLAYLVDSGEAQYRQLAYQQFIKSNNMTDTMGALQALMNVDCEERTKALAQFYEQFKDQPLVVNKWFMLQAGSTLPSTVDNVKHLMQHPAFNIKNPNNVYALVRAFGENPVAFHDKSGAGYRFIADQILALNAINPQVAAVLMQPLSRWKKINKAQQKYMLEELHRIQQAPKLSKDVYEIVTKSLE